jgi:lon-related putative ATP-dependent protease
VADGDGAPPPLPPEALYRRCDPADLPFATTAELEDIDVTVGQTRALAALDFGVRIRNHGYNLFVLGRAGSHRRQIVKDFLKQARKAEAPSDWVYLNNFAEDRKPRAVELPAGQGADLRRDMERLVEELRGAIPAAFESEHFQNSLGEINQDYEERHRNFMEALQQEAKERSLSLVQTPHGFAVAPVRDGEILGDEDYEKLPEDEKKRTADAIEEMSNKLRQHFEELPKWQKERRDRIKALNREVTEMAAGQLIDVVKERYRDFPKVTVYLDAVREDVLDNARDFQPQEQQNRNPMQILMQRRTLNRYEVNLLVDHSENGAAPIVYENNPSVQSLLGRIEHIAEFGALTTDFTMIRPGALHRANGGYLILDAERVLLEPMAWNALKRVLSAREIRIESLGEMLSLASTVSLEPEPIPADLKVILVGERRIYYLLSELDAEFRELFKVAADFENRVDRTAENTVAYGRLLATLARRKKLRALNKEAAARVIEHSARLLGDSEKLTTRLSEIGDLLSEANFWAGESASDVIDAAHVQQAIDAQIHRLDRVRSELQEEIQRRSILIDTDSAEQGQINGLSVLQLGNFAFGQPVRITASIRLGEGKIMDIERETELGGPIHSKGVLILTSYLTATYASDIPLSFGASLVFEQSYEGVEGDSASVAESCALLSAIAAVPIKQSLAVTGSVNQHGRVQVIGGVNEKIEGFFDVCKARGLTGSQGVLIPADNVKHLMLRRDVVDAVRNGQFHVYPITHIDEAITLLTGVTAGTRDEHGEYPPGSVNRLVEQRLKALAEARREFEKSVAKAKRKKKKKTPGKKLDGPGR